MWIVMCQVSGGYTGTRAGVLKHGGHTRRFETKEAAEAEAARLTKELNGPHTVATFRYWAEEECEQ